MSSSPEFEQASTTDALSYGAGARERFVAGDVICFRGAGWVSGLIRLMTGSRYSHVGMVYLFEGRVYCFEAVGHGVRLMLMSELVKHYGGGIDYFENLKADATQRTKAVSFFFRQLGKLYDKRGLFRFFWAIATKNMQPVREDEAWFCSELVVRAFEEGGLNLAELPMAYTSPGDLAQSEKLALRFSLKP